MSDENQAVAYRFDDLTPDHPMPMIERRRIVGERAMISHVRLEKGCVVPTHAHPNEQFACILSGRLRFGLGERGTDAYKEIILGAGEVMHLPPNVPHAAEALDDTVVLDIFSPPSDTTGIDRD